MSFPEFSQSSTQLRSQAHLFWIKRKMNVEIFSSNCRVAGLEFSIMFREDCNETSHELLLRKPAWSSRIVPQRTGIISQSFNGPNLFDTTIRSERVPLLAGISADSDVAGGSVAAFCGAQDGSTTVTFRGYVLGFFRLILVCIIAGLTFHTFWACFQLYKIIPTSY